MKTHLYTILGVCGVAVGVYLGYTSIHITEIVLAAITVAVVQAILLMIIKIRNRKSSSTAHVDHQGKSHPILLLPVLIFALGIVIGGLRAELATEKVSYTCVASCTFTGTIISSPEIHDEYQTFHVRADEVDAKDTYDILVRVPLYPRYVTGSTITLSGKVTAPKVLMPHGGKASFDYPAYLSTKNIGSEMYYPKVEVIDSEAHDMTSLLMRSKDEMVDTLTKSLGYEASLLASGMLFGASSFTRELADTFRTAGLSHIVVLSGFNIAIVISFILFVFAFLPLVLRIVLASLSVLLFVLMVGGEASVIRATLMAFISLLALLLGRVYVSYQALVISFLFIILYSPNALLHDVSLHLSFLATAGIVYLSEPLTEFLNKIRLSALRSTLATTLSAYLVTLPYVLYTFGTFSTYAILSNLLVVPLVPLAMLLSFIVIAVTPFSEILSYIIGYIDTTLLTLIINIARAVEWLPFSSIKVEISFLGMVILYGVLVSLIGYFFLREPDETQVTYEGVIISATISY